MAIREATPYSNGRFGFRRIHIYLAAFALIFTVFILTTPRISDPILHYTTIDDDGNVFVPTMPDDSLESNNNSSNEVNSTGHYNFAILITSKMQDISRRKLLRDVLFNIKDNLVPCQGTVNVYYKFLVRDVKASKKQPLDQAMLRNFKSEFIEFNDIAEISSVSGEGWQETALKWAGKLEVTYDQLVMIDIYTLINIKKLQQIFQKSVINGDTLTLSQKRNIIWGSFSSPMDDAAVILGPEAVSTIIESIPEINASPEAVEADSSNIITKAYYYYQNNNNDNSIYVVDDDFEIIEWANVIESISPESTIAVGHVYQDEEINSLIAWLNIEKTPICIPFHNYSDHEGAPSIVITTSSFVYQDMCMIDVAVPSAENKRSYAESHGYAFVARSAEFAQQALRNRKTVWGKLDAVEKILPRYDWLLWMDMDAVIANSSVTIESLIENFVEITGGKEAFEEKHLIVAKPRGDSMINAGVFLLRNSEWSRKYLREVQGRKNQYFGKFYEQRAMWDVMNEPKWKEGALLLENDDHTFNTFPKRYVAGDFVVHYAPDGCPAKPVLAAIEKIKKLEINPKVPQDFARY